MSCDIPPISLVPPSPLEDFKERILDEKSRRDYWNITSLALALIGGVATYLTIHAIGFHLWILAPWIVLALGFSANNYLAGIRLSDIQSLEPRIQKWRNENRQDHPEVIRLSKQRDQLPDGPQRDDANVRLLYLRHRLEPKWVVPPPPPPSPHLSPRLPSAPPAPQAEPSEPLPQALLQPQPILPSAPPAPQAEPSEPLPQAPLQPQPILPSAPPAPKAKPPEEAQEIPPISQAEIDKLETGFKKALEIVQKTRKRFLKTTKDEGNFKPKRFKKRWSAVCDKILGDSLAPQHSA